MFTHRQKLDAAAAPRTCRGLLLLAALILCAGAEARAASTCSLGFPAGGVINATNHDGVRGPEWTNALLMGSSDPCFEFLKDRTVGDPNDPDPNTTPRNVNVYTMRFTDGGQTFLAFFFEVEDITNSGPSGQLQSGEKIVLQFDSNTSRGAEIQGDTANAFANPLGSDYQIIVTHRWESGGMPDEIGNVQVQVMTRGGVGLGCTTHRWEPVAGAVPAALQPKATLRKLAAPTRYAAEIVVPLALLGNPPAQSFGAALAVLNDFGTMSGNPTGTPFGGGAAFPSSLSPLSSAQNPVGGCRGNWVVPDTWGTGLFDPPPGDVSISRSPAFWNSNQIQVRQCDAAGASYTWYKDTPCRAVIEARLQNTTGSTQTRHLLYLWAQFGTGDPNSYKVVALLTNQTVQPGLNSGPFNTPVWTNMPAGDPAHPCVRVYVLTSNPGVAANATLTGAQVANILNTHGGGDANHWAQKNISASPDPSITTCQTPGCAAVGRSLPRPDADAVAALSGNLFQPAAHTRLATQTRRDDRLPPLVRNPGRNIRMSGREFEQFSRDNVIVQVTTYGYSDPPAAGDDRPLYTFVEELGGVIQLVPVAVLERHGRVPFQFTTFNADRDRTIYQVVDVFTPAGAAGAQVGLDTGRTPYRADESRVVRGYVSLPRRDGENEEQPDGTFKRWGLSLHAGASIPHGSFSNFFDTGPNVGVDLEYRLSPVFSLEGIYTFHRFRGETFSGPFGPTRFNDTNLHVLSLNGKVYGGTSPVRPFLNFGGGAYKFDHSSVRGGLNVGGGLQFGVTPTFALDSMYNFHNVFTSGSDLKFSTVQGGVRFRF